MRRKHGCQIAGCILLVLVTVCASVGVYVEIKGRNAGLSAPADSYRAYRPFGRAEVEEQNLGMVPVYSDPTMPVVSDEELEELYGESGVSSAKSRRGMSDEELERLYEELENGDGLPVVKDEELEDGLK